MRTELYFDVPVHNYYHSRYSIGIVIGPDSPIPPEGQRALEALTLISRKWSPSVLLMLQYNGPQGFNDLLEGVPDLSSKVLSETLEALQEAGLVERQVVQASPLRVKYELTAAGRDMEPIFKSLGEWTASHCDSTTRRVLIAAVDRRITEMYQQWLADRYSVVRAHNTEELTNRFDDQVDVALIDSELRGGDLSEFITGFEQESRTILIVGDRPDFDILAVDCDDLLRKPFVRETLLEAIENQLSRREMTRFEREYASLRARQSLFESFYPQERLDGESTYRTLSARLEELEEQRPTKENSG